MLIPIGAGRNLAAPSGGGGGTFPTVVATDNGEGKNKGYNIGLPAGILSGDRLIVIPMWYNGAQPSVYPAGWPTIILNDNGGGADSQIHAAYRDCDGSEGSSVFWDTDSGRDTGWQVLLLRNCDLTEPPAVSTFRRATGSSNTPNAVTWGWSAPTLVITQCHIQSSVRDTTPAGYTMIPDRSINGGSNWLQTGYKEVASSPEAPGAFGFTASAFSGSITIAVKGA